MKKKLLLLTGLLLGCMAQAAPLTLLSPDGKLKVELTVGNRITYSVYADGHPIMADNTLGLTVDGRQLDNGARLQSAKQGSVNSTVRPAIATNSATTSNRYNYLLVKMQGHWAMEWRAYDNGVAYRLVLNRKGEVAVNDETLDIGLPTGCTVHAQKADGLYTAYEEPYSHFGPSELKPADGMLNLPLLWEAGGGYKVLLSEADQWDYPGFFVRSNGQGGLKAEFPAYPKELSPVGDRHFNIVSTRNYIARTAGRRSLPWRYFVITKDDDRLVFNGMAERLGAVCKLKDCSWIKPGQVSWDWLSGRRFEGVDFRCGVNNETYKYFIDFAARHHVPYIILDEGWARNTQNPYETVEGINLPELIAYGRQRGVGLILWMTWLCTEKHPDVFERFGKMGVAGFKIDFMNRTDQQMVNYYERTVQAAARHHLLIDFHGAYKPAGLEKRYPNLLSYEGVRGQEQGNGCTPANSVWLPFIRNAVGPMDFTPGILTCAQPENAHSTAEMPMSIGTRAYQLALYVVFQSGIQMLSDNPQVYDALPECTDFITAVPVTWDESRVLASQLGQYIVVARRKGSRWYIGAMTNGQPRNITVNLDFLQRSGRLTAFEDGLNADQMARDCRRTVRNVDNSTQLELKLARNGGWAGVISPLQPTQRGGEN